MKFAYIFLFIVYATANAQQVGSKVNLVGTDGKKYTGTITGIQGDKYKIKYDGYDFEPWLTSGQFTVVNNMAPTPLQVQTGGKFKTGDRVEVDKAAIDSWEKGTIMPLLKNDFQDGTVYRVRLDVQARGGMYLEGIIIPVARIRLSNSAAYQPEKTTVTIGKVYTDADNTLSADRAIIQCPVKQSRVVNGAKPNNELFKKLIQCSKGEKAASKGFDGAVTIEVTAMQIGSSRKWEYLRDIGGGPGIIIYPVKVTYTEKTFYRDVTRVSENWIRVLNFYVNNFGEWEIGSQESVKSGDIKNVPRNL